jgi:xanthine/uracil permease
MRVDRPHLSAGEAMSNDKLNPYESPAGIESIRLAHRILRWRLIPTAIIGLLGAVSFVFGMIAVGIMIYVLVTRQNAQPPLLMIAACTLYLGIGIVWIIAARCFWRGRYRTAIAATIVGFVIPAVVFSVFG